MSQSRRSARRPSPAQWVWLTGFQARLIRRLATERDAGEIASWAIVELADHPSRLAGLISRYPNPTSAADAAWVNLSRDCRRRMASQRGEGARRGRRVERIADRVDDEGRTVAFDVADPSSIDPATRAADRDEVRWALSGVSATVVAGLQLEADGLTQVEAAVLLGRSRPHLSRTIAATVRDLVDRRTAA